MCADRNVNMQFSTHYYLWLLPWLRLTRRIFPYRCGPWWIFWRWSSSVCWIFTSLVALGVSTNISSVMMFRVWVSMVVIVFEASLAIAVWRGQRNVLYSWARKKTEVVKNTDRAFIETQKVGRPRRFFLFTTLGTILQVFLEQRWTPEHATCNYLKTTFVPVLDYSCWCVRIINNIHVLIHQVKIWKRQTLKQGHN